MLGLRWGWLLVVPWTAAGLIGAFPVLDAGAFATDVAVALLVPYAVVRAGAAVVSRVRELPQD